MAIPPNGYSADFNDDEEGPIDYSDIEERWDGRASDTSAR